jgi:IclR family transcriptional regulator, mhp operon transcriptional activator
MAVSTDDRVPVSTGSTDRSLGKKPRERCRANSRRGQTDPMRRSYPPVGSVCRAFEVLETVNKLHIATVNGIYTETGLPKSTIVRMLETLMSVGYIARDNMCGGYRVTGKVTNLSAGYTGIPRIIEVARPLALDLTRRIKWPIGLGVIDGDAISIQFWTGTVSPVVHTNTVLGLRPDLRSTAMGRTYLAFCAEKELEGHIARFRKDPEAPLGERDERQLRVLLDRVRSDGYASRDPRTKPYRMTTLGVPLMEENRVLAVMSVSFFRSAVAGDKIRDQVLSPLMATRTNIEHALAFMKAPHEAMPSALIEETLEPVF